MCRCWALGDWKDVYLTCEPPVHLLPHPGPHVPGHFCPHPGLPVLGHLLPNRLPLS